MFDRLPAAVQTALKQAQALGPKAPPGARYDLVPKSCPHCGTIVNADHSQTQLRCPSCGTRFLNISPDKLQLGTTVLLEKQQYKLSDLGTPVLVPPVFTSSTATPGYTGGIGAGVKRTAVAVQDAPGGRRKDTAAAGAAGAAGAGDGDGDGDGLLNSSSSRSSGSSSDRMQRHWEGGSLEAAGAAAAGGFDGKQPFPSAPAPAPAAAGFPDRPMWPMVHESDVLSVISQATGIPIDQLASNNNSSSSKSSSSSSSQWQQVKALTEKLQEAVVGQEAAVAAVAGAVTLMWMGLHQQQQQQQEEGLGAFRPAGSILLVGPDGVGKTTLARALAEALNPNEPASRLILPMGEYAEKHSAAKLVGAPPGYVGYGKGGLLTEALRRRPHSVVLFDDIDRAHPEVIGLLLQALEAGQIMDSLGHTVNLNSAVMLFTATSRGAAAATATGAAARVDGVLGASAKAAAGNLGISPAAGRAEGGSLIPAAAAGFKQQQGMVAGFSSLVNCSLEGATLGEDEEDQQRPGRTAAGDFSSEAAGGAAAGSTGHIASGVVQQQPQWSSSMAELASRVQDVVQLQPLTAAALTVILDRQLAVAVELARQQGVQLVIEAAAREWLVNRTTDGAGTAAAAGGGGSAIAAAAGAASAPGGGSSSVSRGARPIEKLVRGQVLLPVAQVLLRLQEQQQDEVQESTASAGQLVTVQISCTGDEQRPLRIHVP